MILRYFFKTLGGGVEVLLLIHGKGKRSNGH